MKALRNLVLASSLALGAFALVAAPAFAEEPKKEEMKCDTTGKTCKDGANCKVENCKKKEEGKK
jgi:hypothetical protein